MKILIIGTLYEPDLGPSAPLFTLLSKELVNRGHTVTVIAPVPHYPTGKVSAPYRRKWFVKSIENGVNVIRIGLPSINRNHLGERLLQFTCYQIGATIKVIGQQYDVVLAANPFLSVWLPFFWSVYLNRKPAVYSIHDVYPDVGMRLGIFNNSIVIKITLAFERFCIHNAQIIRILSASFQPSLINLGTKIDKIRLIYDWVDTDLIQPLPHHNQFSEENRLCDKFVVQYAGNIGHSQGLEKILLTAEMLANQKDIQFVFIGDGAGRASLESQTLEKQLTNVDFIPFQPREKLPEVLASADISLVILRKGIGWASLPSKTFSIMASGRPILLSVDEGSETYDLVKRTNAGFCIPPENPGELASAILTLKHDNELRQKLGENGRAWALSHHSPQSAAEQFENILIEAIHIHQKNNSHSHYL
jgi:colanic acid biosynthesis glycosyl transferase WcaI